MKNNTKVAILDLYDNTPNQGMRCIKALIHAAGLSYEVFEVRYKADIPKAVDFDIYISTGGPGSPLEGDGIWDKQYFDLMDEIWAWNKQNDKPKKHVLFICHSFQMICNHFELGTLTKRKSTSFGTFPVHKTALGAEETLFKDLPDPFYIADFRDFQLVQPNHQRLEEMGAKLLLLEKKRPHVPLERAIMGIRLSQEWIAVQFHPEADPDGMSIHFAEATRKKSIVETHGQEKFEEMMQHLNESDKIPLTHETIIPNFLKQAIGLTTSFLEVNNATNVFSEV
ncbi:MAG: type 1 glutamine amidotransferase [Chitinophagales bacterium]